MQCRTVLTRVDALRTGELDAPESREVSEHLRTCKSCDESLDDVAELARAVKALIVPAPKNCCTALKSELADHYEKLDVDGKSVWVAFSDRGIRMITTGGTESDFEERYRERIGRSLEKGELPERFRRHVEDALSGRGVKKPVVDLREATDFEREVLNVLTHIPRGEVRSYAWVARQAGKPGAVRAVGSICARNVVPFVVPCHRVVPASGGVGQYAFGPTLKRALLEREGVAVDELDELARRGIRFIGSRTTHIFCVPSCHDACRIREDNRVPFQDAGEAASKGFRPCQRCRPAA